MFHKTILTSFNLTSYVVYLFMFCTL